MGYSVQSKVIGNVEIELNINFPERKREAQKLLNMQIVADSDPYIPFRQGALRNSVRYPEGLEGGLIEYNTPYAHYQYVGEVYGPNFPIYDGEGNLIGFRSPPHKYPTGRPLTYYTEGTGDHWFERAKADHKQEWIKLVGDTIC